MFLTRETPAPRALGEMCHNGEATGMVLSVAQKPWPNQGLQAGVTKERAAQGPGYTPVRARVIPDSDVWSRSEHHGSPCPSTQQL